MTQAGTKQRAYQQRHIARGLCALCPRPRLSSAYCLEHLIAQRTYKRERRGHQTWHPGGKGRPPLEVVLTRRRRRKR